MTIEEELLMFCEKRKKKIKTLIAELPGHTRLEFEGTYEGD